MEIKQIIWIVLYCIALIGIVVGIVTKNITPGESAIGALVVCVGHLLNGKLEKVEIYNTARMFAEGYKFGKLHERINRND